jgi:hypothetical protein
MTPRYKLRILLLLLAILPPLLAVGWRAYSEWRAKHELLRAQQLAIERGTNWVRITVDSTYESDLRKFSEPPATPMQPGEVDVRKLTRPNADARPSGVDR